MSRYETITTLGDEFIKLMSKSLIPVHILDWKVLYEAYLIERTKCKKTEAIEIVCAQYDVSRRQMFYIVEFMEGA